MSFNETEVVQDLEFIGSSNINQVNAYTLLNEIQILPSELISITHAELDSYRPLTTPNIDVTFWLRTLDWKLISPEHPLVWQVIYGSLKTDATFDVLIDAQSGEVLAVQQRSE